MADATFKPSSGDDLVLSNDDASAKVEINEDGTIVLTGLGATSFNDANISNVGDISLDTISSDAGTSIGVTLGTDSGDDFNVGSGKLLVEGDNGNVSVGSGNIVIGTAGKGIDFSNQSNPATGMTSELFDHYEEGTFTANLTSATPPSSVGTLSGTYTKVGNKVTINMWVRATANTTGGSGGAKITGLPFNSGSTQYQVGVFWQLNYINTTDTLFPFMDPNTSQLEFIPQAGGSPYGIYAGQLPYVYLNMTYFTA